MNVKMSLRRFSECEWPLISLAIVFRGSGKSYGDVTRWRREPTRLATACLRLNKRDEVHGGQPEHVSSLRPIGAIRSQETRPGMYALNLFRYYLSPQYERFYKGNDCVRRIAAAAISPGLWEAVEAGCVVVE